MKFLDNVLYNRYIYHILFPIYTNIFAHFITPLFISRCMKRLSHLSIRNKMDTAKVLVNTNKSMGRFGDGELRWMLGNKRGSFEKNSPRLKRCLSKIIKNHNKNYMVALPDAFKSIVQFSERGKKLWEPFIVKYSKSILPYIDVNKIYYNTSVVRPYMDYQNNKIANNIFSELKKIWLNKNILIIEGEGTRLGVNNNLFSNTKSIKRIECPLKYAFESYNNIFKDVKTYLNNSSQNYLTLISLGPTATVLSYDISRLGYRAIDVGHIDAEYSWFKMQAKRPIHIPYKYTNEASNESKLSPINSKKYYEQILMNVK